MKKNLMYIAIASVVLASCSNDTVVNVPSQGDKALGVNVNMVRTKAILDETAFAFTTPIGILRAAANDYTAQVSSYTQADALAEWIPSTPVYLNNKAATIYGFYPNTVDATAITELESNNKLIVDIKAADDFKGTAQADYMYANTATDPAAVAATASNEAGKEKVTLFFHHALAKVTFKVNKDADYNGVCKLTEIKMVSNVGGGLFKTAGTDPRMLLASGALEGLASTSTITLTAGADAQVFTKVKGVDADFGHVQIGVDAAFPIQALVAPITLPVATADALTADNSIQLTLTIDGKPMSVFLTPADGTSWAAANNYVYTITVKPSGLEVDKTVTIVGWAPATEVQSVDIK